MNCRSFPTFAEARQRKRYARVGAGWYFPFAPYGEDWRAARRLFQEKFTAKAVKQYHGAMIKYRGCVDLFTCTKFSMVIPISLLLQNLASSPEKFHDHILHYAAGVILDVRIPLPGLPHTDAVFRLFTVSK